jgi:hypothetical protein
MAKRIIVLCLAVMGFITLCFPMLSVSVDNFMTNIEESENGFHLLSFKSNFIFDDSYEWGAALMGVICVFSVIGSLVSIGLAIASFSNKEKEKTFQIAVIVIILINGAFYMIAGLVFKKTFVESGGFNWLLRKELGDYYGIFKELYIGYDKGSQYVTTSAYIPFIIEFILAIFYIIIHRIAVSGSQLQSSTSNVIPCDCNSQKMQELAKYQRLLEQGLISDLDYETIKRRIMNG